MKILLILILSCLAWSLTEYLLHRFLGHIWKKRTRFRTEHQKHHFKKNYYATVESKLIASISFISVLFVLGFSLVPVFHLTIFILGFTLSYLLYEIIHKLHHVYNPKTYYGKRLRDHHLYHHKNDQYKNFGVTTMLWDRVFRTKSV